MRLTQRLLSYLYSAFDKDPDAFVAFRLWSDVGVLSWAVADRQLTVSVDGVEDAVFDLPGLTIAGLVAALKATPGYVVADAVVDERANMAAHALIDGSGSVSDLNGDRLRAYQSLTWAYLDACAVELTGLSSTAGNAPLQLATASAEGEWLDEIGGYYNVARLVGERDADYGPRIIAETIAPKSNNVALEIAIARAFGQDATVTDVRVWGAAFPLLNGAISLDGTHQLNAAAQPLYGLFDVAVSFDLEGGSGVDEFKVRLKAFVDRVRAAGTHLRALELTGSQLSDIVPECDDGPDIAFLVNMDMEDGVDAVSDDMSTLSAALVGMEDAVDSPVDEAVGLSLSWTTRLNGARRLSGGFPLASGVVLSDTVT